MDTTHSRTLKTFGADAATKPEVRKGYEISPFDGTRDPKYVDNVALTARIVVAFEIPRGKFFTRVEARGRIPAYWHMKRGQVNIHLRDELQLPEDSWTVVGIIEVSIRKTESGRAGFESREYVSVNLYPAASGEEATHRLDVLPSPDEEVEGDIAYRFDRDGGSVVIVGPALESKIPSVDADKDLADAGALKRVSIEEMVAIKRRLQDGTLPPEVLEDADAQSFLAIYAGEPSRDGATHLAMLVERLQAKYDWARPADEASKPE